MSRLSGNKLITKVDPAAMRRYAERAGWVAVEDVPDYVSVYQRPGAKGGELVVPVDRTLGDFIQRIEDAISVLARHSDRSLERVLMEVVLPPSDFIKVRALGSDTDRGTVPLDQGIDLIAGGRKALLASACSVSEPQQFYPKMQRANTEDFIKACLLGQSENESYSINIICPIDAIPPRVAPTDQISLFPGRREETFTRQVTKTLMKSVDIIVSAIDASDEDRIIKPQPGDMIVSANLCEALVEMQLEGPESSLEVYSTWSQEIEAPATSPLRVAIARHHFPVIAQIGAKLRPKIQPKRSRFVGKFELVKITAKDETQPHGEGVVILIEEGETIRVKVKIETPDEYVACGHAWTNRDLVAFEGELHRKDRSFWIEHQSSLRIIQQDKLFGD